MYLLFQYVLQSLVTQLVLNKLENTDTQLTWKPYPGFEFNFEKHSQNFARAYWSNSQNEKSTRNFMICFIPLL